MTKTVLTYSWLAKRAMSLFRRDEAEYLNMMTNGTERLVRGAKIWWAPGGDHRHSFRIGRPNSDLVFCFIHGAVRDGKMYTVYEPQFTPSTYSKRLTDRFLPITLPDGVRSARWNSNNHCTLGVTPCYFHNADGSVASRGEWHGGRPRRIGEPSLDLVIRDEDGAFVTDEVFATANCLSKISRRYDQGFSRLHIGWFEGASVNRSAWLESIKAIPETHCNSDKMMSLAAKTYLAAHRFCQKYPSARMAMFPAQPAAGTHHWMGSNRYPRHDEVQTVMQRNDNGDPDLWYLPEVLVYWSDAIDSYGQAVYSFLSMMVPPVGSPLLCPEGRAAGSSFVARYANRHYSSWRRVVFPLAFEMPYHSLRAISPGDDSDFGSEAYIVSNDVVSYEDAMSSENSREPILVRWDKARGVVRCRFFGTDETICPPAMDSTEWYGMKPDEAVGLLEEKFLMSSLPLC